jgi:hypothetical protein
MIGVYGEINNSPNLYKEQEYAITFVLKRNFQIFAAPSKNSVYPHIRGVTPIKGYTQNVYAG